MYFETTDFEEYPLFNLHNLILTAYLTANLKKQFIYERYYGH